MKNVVSLIERYGEVRFVRKIDNIAKQDFENWVDTLECCICGGHPNLLNWGKFRRHYCLGCARREGLDLAALDDDIDF